MENEIMPIIKRQISEEELNHLRHPAIFDDRMVVWQGYKSLDEKVIGTVFIDCENKDWAYAITAMGESGRVPIDWRTGILNGDDATTALWDSMDEHHHLACKNAYTVDEIARNKLRIALEQIEERRQQQAEQDLKEIKEEKKNGVAAIFSSLVERIAQ